MFGLIRRNEGVHYYVRGIKVFRQQGDEKINHRFGCVVNCKESYRSGNETHTNLHSISSSHPEIITEMKSNICFNERPDGA